MKTLLKGCYFDLSSADPPAVLAPAPSFTSVDAQHSMLPREAVRQNQK